MNAESLANALKAFEALSPEAKQGWLKAVSAPKFSVKVGDSKFLPQLRSWMKSRFSDAHLKAARKYLSKVATPAAQGAAPAAEAAVKAAPAAETGKGLSRWARYRQGAKANRAGMKEWRGGLKSFRLSKPPPGARNAIKTGVGSAVAVAGAVGEGLRSGGAIAEHRMSKRDEQRLKGYAEPKLELIESIASALETRPALKAAFEKAYQEISEGLPSRDQYPQVSDLDWAWYDVARSEALARAALGRARGKTDTPQQVGLERQLGMLRQPSAPETFARGERELTLPEDEKKRTRPETWGQTEQERYEGTALGQIVTAARGTNTTMAPWARNTVQGVTDPLGTAGYGLKQLGSLAFTGEPSGTPFYQKTSGAVEGIWDLTTEPRLMAAIALEGDSPRGQALKKQLDAIRAAKKAGNLSETPAGATPPTGEPEPKGLKSTGAKTFQDFIDASLRGAGFGTPKALAYRYDPFNQSGGTAPWQMAALGHPVARNPFIAGGREPTLKDVARMHQGTHESQAAFADQLDQQGMDMKRAALGMVVPAYQAHEASQGTLSGLQQAQAKQSVALQATAAANIYKEESRQAAILADNNRTKEANDLRGRATLKYAQRLDALGLGDEEPIG